MQGSTLLLIFRLVLLNILIQLVIETIQILWYAFFLGGLGKVSTRIVSVRGKNHAELRLVTAADDCQALGARVVLPFVCLLNC